MAVWLSRASWGLLAFLLVAPQLAHTAQLDKSYYPPATSLRVHVRTPRYADAAELLSGKEEEQQPLRKPAWAGLFELFARGKAEPKIELAEDAAGHARFTATLALILFFVPPIIAVTLTNCLPPCLAKESVVRRYYGYLFMAHRNANFGANFELAMRGTIGVMILAIPFLSTTYNDLIASGYYTSTAVMLFVFTLYKTVGDTVQIAFQGILGTFIAVLNIWIMLGIFPEGVSEDSAESVWYISVTEGILYVLFIVGSDLDTGCKMFALNWWMFFWMDFLNPSVTGVYSSNWKINIKGPAISGLVQSCIGVGVAVLVTLVPFPLFALDKARDISLNLSEELSDAFDSALKCFVSAEKDQLSETKLRHDIQSVSEGVGSMGGYASISWWENLSLPGKPQKVRDFIIVLSATVQEAYKRLQGLRHICRVTTRGPEHTEIMDHVKPHLENLSKQTGDLLKTLAACAVDGSFDDEELATIADQKAKVKASMKTLTTEFEAKKAEMKADLFYQAAFCMSYCAYARIVMDFEAVLQQNADSAFGMIFQNIYTTLMKFKIPIFTDATVRNCWLRSSIAILLCFAVGYRGYSAILPGYNATPAAVVSLLLSSGLTAAPTKNLKRFEGVVLGIVFGQIAYALLGWCSMSGYIGVGIFLFVWSLSTFILYFHTTDFMLLGCLLAAFGVVGVLRGCSDDVFEAGGSYNTVVGVTVAITIKVLVDCMLSSARSSEEATNELVRAWDMLEKTMKDFFEPEAKVITFKNAGIKGSFEAAYALSIDADTEPRLWWCAWKQTLFKEVCDSGCKISESLSNLEAAFSKTGKDGGEKSRTLELILQDESAGKLKEALLTRIAAMKSLCFEAFSYNKDGFFAAEYEQPKGLPDFAGIQKTIKDVADNLQKAGGMSTSAAGEDDDALANLEYDMNCKIGVFFYTVEWMVELMESIDQSVLSQ
jgi:hypothetical protein